MVINILKAKQSKVPVQFEGFCVLDSSILLRDNTEFKKPVAVSGTYEYFVDEVVFDGKVCFELKTLCDRCGKEIEISLSFPLKERFVKDSIEPEIYSYTNDTINLTLAVSECIMTNLSFQYFCNAKCKGLCEICGANLNEKKCKCKKENNAFSVLKDINKKA